MVLSGSRFTIDAETEFNGIDDLSTLVTGTSVNVTFAPPQDGSFLAIELEVEEEGTDADGDAEVIGTITSVTAENVEVNGLLFALNADTRIEGPRGAILAADLYSGLIVEVQGRRQADGDPIAEKIKIETELETGLKVKGEIADLTESTIKIGDVTALVTAETIISGERDAVLSFAGLQLGALAEAELLKDADGTLTALRIEVENPFEARDVEIAGHIEAVSASEITVGGLAFSIDAGTEVEARKDASITAADLSVGQAVRVKGYDTTGGTRVATHVRVKERVHAEGELEGPITAVQAGVVEVAGTRLRLAPQTRIKGSKDLSTLQAGQRVEVDFRLLGDGSRLALHIKPEDDQRTDVLFKGIVGSVGTESFVAAGIDLGVTSETVLSDAAGASITLADLPVGAMVRVQAEVVSGTLVALQVRAAEAAVMAGAVQARGAGTVQVAGRDVAITAETRVFGRDNTELSLDDVQPGAFIEVLAISQGGTASKAAATTATAESIQVKQGVNSTAREDEAALPEAFVLEQNYPNPFNPATTIGFRLPQQMRVTLKVYNVLGQEVATLLRGTLPAGLHEAQWNGQNGSGQTAASGLYLYRLEAGGQVQTRLMTLVK